MSNKTKIIIGIATQNAKSNSFEKAYKSLLNQSIKPDKIIVYNNDNNYYNATDNGKFYFFNSEDEYIINEECYFFSCDDDIEYDDNYIAYTLAVLQEHNNKVIVSYHGRILEENAANYYSNHIRFSCFDKNNTNLLLDVLGTGVTAFHTSYFKPKYIFRNENKLMTDLLISYQIAKENKTILYPQHNLELKNIEDLNIEKYSSCYRTMTKNQSQLVKFADSILYHKKNPNILLIIPFKGRRGYLQEAIDSVDNNNYKNISLVLAEGEDTWPAQFNCALTNQNIDNFQYVKYMHDDDVLPDISQFINYVYKNRSDYNMLTDVYHTRAHNFFNNNYNDFKIQQCLTPDFTLNEMLENNQIHGGTLFYKQYIFNHNDYNLRIDQTLWTGEEYDFNLNLLKNNFKFKYIDINTIYYRRHTEQKSLGNPDKEYQKKRKKTINEIKERYIN
jgi:hypothetical protein